MSEKHYYKATPRLPDNLGLESLSDKGAEEYVLGCLLQGYSVEDILNALTPGDFSEPINGLIFRHISQLRAEGKAIGDFQALLNSLGGDKEAMGVFNDYGKETREEWNNEAAQIKALQLQTISGLMSTDIGSGAQYLGYVSRLKELRGERETRIAAYKLSNAATTGEENKAVIAEVIDSLQRVIIGDTGGSLLKPETEETIGAEIAATPGGIDTGYILKTAEGEKVPFTIPPGAVTLICGLPGHCKSVMLRNLALRMAVDLPGDILYFSFEESKAKTETKLLSAFIGAELQAPKDENRGNNIRAIEHFYKTGETRYITTAQVSNFNARRAEYIKLRTSGKLRIYSPDFNASELVAAINAYRAKRPVSAILIDYIQFLKSARNVSRIDELRDIAQNLLNLAKASGIPIIAAAQYNRSVSGPWDLSGGTIAESQDLTRYADTILGLWNSKKSDDIKKDSPGASSAENRKKFSDFIEGKPGTLYARLNKSRETEAGAEAFLPFNGKIGLIGETIQAFNDFPAADDKSNMYNNFKLRD